MRSFLGGKQNPVFFRTALVETIFIPVLQDAFDYQDRLIQVVLPRELNFESMVASSDGHYDVLFSELFDAESTLYPLLEHLSQMKDMDRALTWLNILIDTAISDLKTCTTDQEFLFQKILKVEKENLR